MSIYTPTGDKSPERPKYSEYRRYFCKICSEECINHRDDARTKYRECVDCFSIPDLDEADDTPADLGDDDLDDRQAGDLVSGEGEASERPSENPPTSRSPDPRAERAEARNGGGVRSDGSEVPSTLTSVAIGDAHERLSHRRGKDE